MRKSKDGRRGQERVTASDTSSPGRNYSHGSTTDHDSATGLSAYEGARRGISTGNPSAPSCVCYTRGDSASEGCKWRKVRLQEVTWLKAYVNPRVPAYLFFLQVIGGGAC